MPRLKTVLPIVVFVMAAALTYLGVTQWPKARRQQATYANDTIAGIDGLVEGDVVTLPELRTIKNEPVALESVSTERFLFAFFTPSCAGCSLDAALWTSLTDEAAKRRTAFYLIDVGHDRSALEKFVEAHDLGSLPILVSDGCSVGQMLKVNIVPQYLLVDKDGKVLHRWDGVQHNKQPLFGNANKE
jgi:peroxiredoxin